jgi:hypothetical protein
MTDISGNDKASFEDMVDWLATTLWMAVCGRFEVPCHINPKVKVCDQPCYKNLETGVSCWKEQAQKGANDKYDGKPKVLDKSALDKVD